MGVFPYSTKQGKTKVGNLFDAWQLLLRKPVEEGIPPSPFSGLKMALTHGYSAKTHEFTQTEEIIAHTPLAVSCNAFTWDSFSSFCVLCFDGTTWSF